MIKRIILFSLFSFSLFTNISAQNDAYHNALLASLQSNHGLTGGTWVLTPNENINANNAASYGCATTQNTITGQDFSKAINLNITAPGSNVWDAGYFNPNVNAIQQGDRVLFVVWLRTISAAQTDGQVSIFVEDGVTYHKEVYLTTNFDNQWTQYLIPFEATDNYAVGELNIGFHLSYQQQEIEFGGLALVNYGTSVAMSQLPQAFNIKPYDGQAANAPWRAAAASRIEQHRKADLQLQVLDGQGNPLANTPVRVKMLRHLYAFGSAVNPVRLANNSNFNATYQNKILDLDGNGHGFNWVVTENALKWDAWEATWAGSKTEKVNALQWLVNNQIKVRGHVLVWPGFNFMPSDMQANSTNPTFMENRMLNRVADMLNYPGVRENVREWDVINEIVHVRDVENALQGQAGYTTGREFYPTIFNKTQQEDPNVITYLNDYNILNNGSVHGADYLLYKSFFQEILTAGANIDGIGFQAHMNSSLIAPDSLYAILEDAYTTFGKTIKITEYDQAQVIPDSLAAQYTGDFLTTIFSHRATDGFLMWGFWDGAHWLGNAPLFYPDWTPKPTLGKFNDLVFNQWWTDSTMTTDANGLVMIRGFKGDYQVTATLNGNNVVANLALHDNLNTSIQLFNVNTKMAFEAKDIIVSPNPATDYISLKMPYNDKWSITLLDELGRIVHQATVQELLLLDTNAFANGIYYFKIMNQNGESVSKKVILF
jgi:endo-1,4-beta-xylanase